LRSLGVRSLRIVILHWTRDQVHAVPPVIHPGPLNTVSDTPSPFTRVHWSGLWVIQWVAKMGAHEKSRRSIVVSGRPLPQSGPCRQGPGQTRSLCSRCQHGGTLVERELDRYVPADYLRRSSPASLIRRSPRAASTSRTSHSQPSPPTPSALRRRESRSSAVCPRSMLAT
jgi:hypothetical protein